MKVIYGLSRVPKFKNPVVAIGVFDGVHLAHQYLLRSAVRKARRINGSSIVLTFYPHPQKKKSLYSLSHRLKIFKKIGIDVCIVVGFDRRFLSLSADDFVKKVLADKIRARYVYVGKNFRFGKGAEGNWKLLKKLSIDRRFRLKIFEVKKTAHRPISSTYIRGLIKSGRIRAAERLLQRPVSILGKVISGSSLGGRLGFPTANISPQHEVIPALGIYAVRVILGLKSYKGVCYIGTKPTILKGATFKNKIHIETHIFNFNRNIYGKELEIQFIKKIRREEKFPSISILVKNIKKDIIAAKKIFSHPA